MSPTTALRGRISRVWALPEQGFLGFDGGQGFPYGQCQLVNAGSSLDAALDSFQAGLDLIYGQTLAESGNAFGVAIASPYKLDVCHDISL